MNLRLHLLGALLACHSGALGGPVVSGNWASHLAAGEVEQMCRVAAGSSNFPVIKLDVYTSQAGYVDHEGDPPRHIVFAEVFFAAEQKHARYETGKALTIEKKEAAGPEGWTIEGRPNKWLQVNAPGGQTNAPKWYGNPFGWNEAVKISDAIAIVDLTYRKTFGAKDEDLNAIPNDLAEQPITGISCEHVRGEERV